MVAGLYNGGLALGATTGPISVGGIIDALDFPWAQTVLGFADLTMVSNSTWEGEIIDYYWCYKINLLIYEWEIVTLFELL